ncbi:NAD-dependent deacetylase [Vibrio sp. HN007]|uniref:SIR2 family NAD-dependent protein deacylase n=1 Tax=Vibrio iocasae TaxID=3098914 RepID=UPI0035D51F94
MLEFEQRLKQLSSAINEADAILIGAGAGFSAAAGLTYSGARFENNFSEHIKRYGISDMYSAGFYPFETPEEKWAYWAKHIYVNRYQPGATKLYRILESLVNKKNYFVITTNVDHQFQNAGFEEERIFATQGDYGLLQCAKPCHNKLYDNEKIVSTMLAQQSDLKVPKALIPKCPVCGGPLDTHLRKDRTFVENDQWHQAAENYQQFVGSVLNKKLLLLEFGVGYNTPSIIKYPFEQITAQALDATLVRFNRDYPEVSDTNKGRTIVFDEDVVSILNRLLA